MADDQPAGPVEHLITVQYDSASSTLDLQQRSTAAKLGDTVVWQFFGMPDGWSPWIEFRPQENGTQFLGPFTDLTQSAAALWGEIRNDPGLVGKAMVYRVFIQKGIGTGWDEGEAVVSSAAGTLAINSEDHGTLQTFTVTPADSGHSLKVSPIGVIIQPGDTVEWDFKGIPDPVSTWRPVVSFNRYDGKGKVPNQYMGPFASLTTGIDRVRGMGNNEVPGTYYFKVSVVRLSDGEILWIGSDDPAIDNRGGVGDPTGGGTGG
jgi:plastocyanin